MNILEIIAMLFSLPGFACKVGIMVASAMLLGAIVDGEWKHYIRWFVLLLVFSGYMLWFHVSVLNTQVNSIANYDVEIVATLFIMLLWTSGVFLGIFIIEKAKAPYAIEQMRLQKRLESVATGISNLSERTNGHTENAVQESARGEKHSGGNHLPRNSQR